MGATEIFRVQLMPKTVKQTAKTKSRSVLTGWDGWDRFMGQSLPQVFIICQGRQERRTGMCRHAGPKTGLAGMGSRQAGIPVKQRRLLSGCADGEIRQGKRISINHGNVKPASLNFLIFSLIFSLASTFINSFTALKNRLPFLTK